MHHLLLILHLLSATVWVGGHLLLSIRFLPKAIKEKSLSPILDYEKQYEIVGIPALLILVATGFYMAHTYYLPFQYWFSFRNSIEVLVSFKLILLIVTLILALHARLFILPKLTIKNLPFMAFHILLITIVGVSMLITGSFFRFGGF